MTQQGIAHFETDSTHPLELILHIFRFYATSFQMDSMSVRDDDDDDDDDEDDDDDDDDDYGAGAGAGGDDDDDDDRP